MRAAAEAAPNEIADVEAAIPSSVQGEDRGLCKQLEFEKTSVQEDVGMASQGRD